eukprot:scaffold677574_cov51-Prasinocladus_malaysianus.AAC.1
MAHARVEAAISRLNNELTRVFDLEPSPGRSLLSPPARGINSYDSSGPAFDLPYEYEYKSPDWRFEHHARSPVQPYVSLVSHSRNSTPMSRSTDRYPDIEAVYGSPTALKAGVLNLCQ